MKKTVASGIEKKATEILQQLGLYRAPVNVESVAKALGADVVFDEMEDDVSGFLLRENGKATIAVNDLHHPNRRRFTLAHECGHLVLHESQGDRLWLDKAYYYRNAASAAGDKKEEIEANRFAAALLMPADLVREHLPVGRSISDSDAFQLAFKFEVSEQAMTLRLASLGIINLD